MVHIPSCPLCSGRRPFCIHKSYPFPKVDVEGMVKEKLKKDFFGPSYSIFVGKRFYPDVFAGPMLGIEEREGIDSPSSWYGMDYSKIIELRSFLLRSKKGENVHSRSRFIQDMQELALAKKPADVEMRFRKTPVFSFSLSEAFQPMGPSATMEKMKVTENVRVKQKVERIVSDELKAGEQAFLLYQAGMDVYKLSSIFSSGALGLEQTKKLVPSRWSVTGIDDIIAKNLMEKIRGYPSINNYMVFESSYLDNHFVILLMPGNWEFENFEVWAPGSNWSVPTQSRIIEEYEPYEGRSDYASGQAGAYYSVRLGISEFLKKIKRQSRAVVFREVGEGYTIPMGVFVIRECVRNAFKQSHRKFTAKKEALEYVSSKLRIPISEYMKQSKILRQKRLVDF